MGKKKASGGKGISKQEAKELKKKKQEEKASKAAKKKSGKVEYPKICSTNQTNDD